MATTVLTTYVEENVALAEYASLTDGQSGDPCQLAKYVSRTVQITGNFGVGGTVLIEGSNDAVNWFGITDDGAALVSFTAAGGNLLYENPRHLRARVSAGTGVNVKVNILAAG